MEKPISKTIMLTAFEHLDKILPKDIRLIMGGGGAMIMAHQFPLATTDVDAIPKGMSVEELDPLIKTVGLKLNLPGDWMNPYFATFAIHLPLDFESRLIEVFAGAKLQVLALGKEDMLIMKCFAHRTKDIGHAKKLIQLGADLAFVEKHIEKLRHNKMPEAAEALDFLDMLMDGEL